MWLNTHERTRTLLPLIAASGILSLNGCDRFTPKGTSETISLLRSGSERVCVAADVQKALRGLILPKPNEFDKDVSTADAQSALEVISLTFDTTTLQSTDKSVSKASCTTTARMRSLSGESDKFHITYDVSPSAEDPNHVVVSGDADDAAAYAKSEIGNVIAHQNQAKEQAQEAEQEEQAQRQLLATITPKWLVGAWIGSGADASQCSNGQGLIFHANHTLEGTELTGRWVLTQDHLHAVGQGASGAAELDGTISVADPLSFTIASKDGAARSFRRCTRDEVNASSSTGLSDTFAPAQPTAN